MNAEEGGGDLVGEDEEDIGLPGGATFGLCGRASWCWKRRGLRTVHEGSIDMRRWMCFVESLDLSRSVCER